MNWTTITKLNVATIENTESLSFQINENKDFFRMINDYGNNSFTFDIMTGYEAISRIKESMEQVINQELQSDFRAQNNKNENSYADSTISVKSNNDCQGDLNG
tara:strand:- start:11300 stop:11608 length:309 start_codon:yes stop_codon:yes gene_type:complete